jgi:hypothetical protein
VAAGVLLAAEVAYVLVDVTDVIEPGTAAAALVQTLLVIAGLGALLFGHLSLVATLAPARRLAWALGVAAGLVAFAEFTEFADRDSFDAVPSFVGSVRPMGSSAGHGVSLDAFIEGASELRLDVDALARVQRR